MKFLFLLVSLFYGIHSLAEVNDFLLECRVRAIDYEAVYKIKNDGKISILGQVNQDAFSCNLNLQEIQDTRGGRSVLKFRIQSLRKDNNCNKDISFDLKRGLQEHLDLVIYKDYAEIYLFEGYDRLRCTTFNFKEIELVNLAKSVNLRSVNSLSPKRKVNPLKIKSLQKNKLK